MRILSFGNSSRNKIAESGREELRRVGRGQREREIDDADRCRGESRNGERGGQKVRESCDQMRRLDCPSRR